MLIGLSASCQTPAVLDSAFFAGVFNNSVPAPGVFRARFNCEQYSPQVDTSSSNGKLTNIFTLFNRDMFTTMNSKTDPKFAEAGMFCKLVADSSYRLNLEDTSYFAVATCSAKYKGKDAALTLWFAINNAKYGFPVWTMVKAEADFLNPKAADTVTKMYISSTSQNINFMDFPAVVQNNSDNILNYCHPDCEVDQLSVLMYLVKSKMLTVDMVTGLKIVFCQVPGYIFEISRSQRFSDNSGWLITKLDRISEASKAKFINNLYNIKR